MAQQRFVLSDESINSYGFRVLTKGIDLSMFEKNPVMLYMHDQSNILGKWVDVKVDGEKLSGAPEFDTDDELATKLSKKVEKGYLNATSIGLQVTKWGVETDKLSGKEVAVALSSVLKEVSLVTVPSNRNALRLYDDEGVLIDEEQIQLSVSEVFKQNPHKKMVTKENLNLLGLGDNPSETDINQAIANLAGRVNTLEAEQKAQRQKQVTDLVDAAVTSGKIKAEKKAFYVSLGEKDFDGLKQIVEDMKVPSKPTQHLADDKGGKKTDVTGREDWSFDKWRKEDPKGLLKLKDEDAETYNALLNGSPAKRNI